MEKLKTIGSFIAPSFLILSVLADISGLLSNLNVLIKIVMLVSAIVVFIYASYFLKERKKQQITLDDADKSLRDANKSIEYLEREICEGKKFCVNEVDVTFDIPSRQYRFEFRKNFKIFSEACTWFPAQFYCNKILGDAAEAKEYYGENPVDWETLDINAQLSFKNPDAERFTEKYELVILHVAEGGNYKQFHVEFKEKNSGVLLNIKNGAEIELVYRYKAPIKIWGSFLNRTISYFAESASVRFLCEEQDLLKDCGIKLCILDPIKGEPKLMEHQNITYDRDNSMATCTIKLPSEKFGKYRVIWDSGRIFGQGEQSTPNVVDASQLTKY